MGKFYGPVGFGKAEPVETSPGVWEVKIIEKMFYGDVLTNINRNDSSSEQMNDNIILNNKVSIVADPYAMMNYHNIRYVKINCIPWKVNSVEERYPRLILNLGGVYVEQEQ